MTMTEGPVAQVSGDSDCRTSQSPLLLGFNVKPLQFCGLYPMTMITCWFQIGLYPRTLVWTMIQIVWTSQPSLNFLFWLLSIPWPWSFLCKGQAKPAATQRRGNDVGALRFRIDRELWLRLPCYAHFRTARKKEYSDILRCILNVLVLLKIYCMFFCCQGRPMMKSYVKQQTAAVATISSAIIPSLDG